MVAVRQYKLRAYNNYFDICRNKHLRSCLGLIFIVILDSDVEFLKKKLKNVGCLDSRLLFFHREFPNSRIWVDRWIIGISF